MENGYEFSAEGGVGEKNQGEDRKANTQVTYNMKCY